MLGIAVLLGLVMTVEPVKAEVTLGEPVEIKVTVKNDGKEAERCPPVLLDKRSVTLAIGEGGGQFVYQRLNDQDPNTAKNKDLQAGETRSGTVSWTPTRAGDYPIEASFAGKCSAKTKVTVKPGEGGATEMGIVMKTGKGVMRLRFFPEIAPNHVAHFAERVRTGFYDGTQFHRVIKGFMAQGGDPTSKDNPGGAGGGGPGYSVPQEFSRKPEYSHTLGRLSTARTQDPDTGGSQFFICFDGAQQLDGQYTVLGEVFDGQETVKELEKIGGGGMRGTPSEFVKLEKAIFAPVTPREKK